MGGRETQRERDINRGRQSESKRKSERTSEKEKETGFRAQSNGLNNT